MSRNAASDDGAEILERQRLERGRRFLPALLSLLIGNEREGVVRRLDLADLSLEIDDQDLAWCDRLLLALSLSPLRDDAPGSPRLLYMPTLGLARSSRRDVGRLGPFEDLVSAVLDAADHLGDDLNRATESLDGDTLLLSEPETPSSKLIVAGVVLGIWSLHGRPESGELLTATSLGRHGTVREDRHLSRSLVRSQERERSRWFERLAESWSIGFHETWLGRDVAAEPSPRAMEPPGREERRLLTFLQEGAPGRRILVGPRGSGRCRTVVAALVASARRSRVTVLVPDLGWGARFHRIWHDVAGSLEPPRLVVAPATRDLGRRLDPAVLPRGDGVDVLVVLGLEEHPAALRYQLAQRQRDGQLVAVLEPHLFEESWEHLLLTQPEAEETITFERLTETAKTIRDERADWLEMSGSRTRLGKTRSRDKGEVAAISVTNLDNALGVLDDSCADDALVAPVDVIAPLLSDLEYLGRGAARRGWLPVYRWELDALQLPGALPFLAAVCDASRTADAAVGVEDRRSWLRPLLPEDVRSEYEAWLRDVDPEMSLDDFAARLRRAGWGVDVFSPAHAAARLEALVGAAPHESLARYASRPLLEVWRNALGSWSGMPSTLPSGPVLTLSTPERCGGGEAATVVHLCSGHEGARFHYRIAGRAGRRLLLLHQNASPLAGDAAES